MALLEIRGLTVTYGGLPPTRSRPRRRAGQLVGLIGPDGAGKTTAIDAITGFTHVARRGDVDGVDLAGKTPDRRAHLGLSRTFQ